MQRVCEFKGDGSLKNGKYEFVIAPDKYPGKKYRGRYAYEHHVRWWKHTGITISPGMEIHHINGNHRDNRIDNLLLLSKKEHQKIHSELNRVPKAIVNCARCGKEKSLKPNNYRFKVKNGQKYFFCSQSCQAIFQHLNGGKLR